MLHLSKWFHLILWKSVCFFYQRLCCNSKCVSSSNIILRVGFPVKFKSHVLGAKMWRRCKQNTLRRWMTWTTPWPYVLVKVDGYPIIIVGNAYFEVSIFFRLGIGRYQQKSKSLFAKVVIIQNESCIAGLLELTFSLSSRLTLTIYFSNTLGYPMKKC